MQCTRNQQNVLTFLALEKCTKPKSVIILGHSIFNERFWLSVIICGLFLFIVFSESLYLGILEKEIECIL